MYGILYIIIRKNEEKVKVTDDSYFTSARE